MEWLFRLFFGLIGVCILITVIARIKNLLSAEHTCAAVVKERTRQVFPVTIGSVRKDRMECRLTFFIPEQQKTLTFDVSEALYEQCPVGAGGTLTFRGDRLKSFLPGPGPS